jgi:hypothetical protein
LPVALSQLIVRLLAKKPGERPHSAETVVAELREIEARLIQQPAPIPMLPPPKPAPWRKSIAVGLIGLVALAAVAVAIRIKNKDGSTTVLQIAAEEVVVETSSDPLPLPETLAARTSLSSTGLRFEGVDDYVHVPSLEFKGSPLTLEAWITPDRVTAGYDRSGIIGWDWRVRLSIDTKADGVLLCGQAWTPNRISPNTPTLWWAFRTAGGRLEHGPHLGSMDVAAPGNSAKVA